jgi:MFS family permease
MSETSVSAKVPPVDTVSGKVNAAWVVALLMLVVAFGQFNRVSITTAGAERLIPKVGISETAMGAVYTAFLLCYTFAMLPGGWLIDRYGPRAALAVVCAGSVVFVALTGLTGLFAATPEDLWLALLVIRFVMGATNAPLHPASAHMVGRFVPRTRVSLANGLVTFAACVGIAAAYVLFGKLMDFFDDWSAAFYACSGMTALVFLIWVGGTWRLAKKSQTAHTAGKSIDILGDLRFLFGHRRLICLTLSYAAMGYFQYLFFYWVEYYFKEMLHQPDQTARLYAAYVVLANGVGMVLGGVLADQVPRWIGRRGLVLVPIAGLVGAALALVAGLLWNEWPEWTLFWFIAAMFALGLCEAPSWTTAVALGGRRGGTAAGLMNTGGNAGGLISPVLAPKLSELFGWQWGMGIASLVALVGAILWVGVDSERE